MGRRQQYQSTVRSPPPGLAPRFWRPPGLLPTAAPPPVDFGLGCLVGWAFQCMHAPDLHTRLPRRIVREATRTAPAAPESEKLPRRRLLPNTSSRPNPNHGRPLPPPPPRPRISLWERLSVFVSGLWGGRHRLIDPSREVFRLLLVPTKKQAAREPAPPAVCTHRHHPAAPVLSFVPLMTNGTPVYPGVVAAASRSARLEGRIRSGWDAEKSGCCLLG